MIDDFINDVIRALENLNDGSINGKRDGESTIVVKKALINVAERHDLFIHSGLKGEKNKCDDGKEWLYDVIIFSLNKDSFDEVYLVCESEWDPDFEGIQYDFEKLLFARSKVRLLVYQVPQEKKDEYRSKLINEIENSGSCLSGDVYLFAVYINGLEELKVEKYIKE